jgi:hypothetical protein
MKPAVVRLSLEDAAIANIPVAPVKLCLSSQMTQHQLGREDQCTFDQNTELR